ncbi:MAG: hypothetical protein JW934_15460 [Anaerolineae bacterium]|nr:hypothetical protein [Anaerolineae bacterium]
MSESQIATLLETPQNLADRALAARYAPIILFDTNEPFLPLAAGYTIFCAGGLSPSFRQGHQIRVEPPAALAIEYAIWWDWDIGHLYELEHVWVWVDAGGEIAGVRASWHGDQHDMRHGGRLRLEGTHPVVYSEPGKHAFAPTPEWFKKRAAEFKRPETSALAGASGVLVTEYIRDGVRKTPFNDLLVRSYLAQQAFEPGWNFSNRFEFVPEMFVPWPALRAWMPGRVQGWLDRLARDLAPDQYRFWRIGHRGARAYAPDNTLTGFRRAAALGADMVELDVQRTVDGQIAVIHDDHLIDADGRVLFVRRSMLEALQAVDLGNGERVPTLQAALDLCQAENIGAYVEIKDGGVIPALVELIRVHEHAGHCLFGSFRLDWIAELKARVPQVGTSILFNSLHVDPVALARSAQANYVHPCWERFDHSASLLAPEWMAGVREAGLGVICWHEERPVEIAALRQVGVDGICSDAPDLLLAEA